MEERAKEYRVVAQGGQHGAGSIRGGPALGPQRLAMLVVAENSPRVSGFRHRKQFPPYRRNARRFPERIFHRQLIWRNVMRKSFSVDIVLFTDRLSLFIVGINFPQSRRID